MIKSALSVKYITYRELESLLGVLLFAAKVVVPGRAFLRRMFNELASKAHIHRIHEDMRADLRW